MVCIGMKISFSLILIWIFWGVGSFTETRLMDRGEIVKDGFPLTFHGLDVMSLVFFSSYSKS